MKSAMMMTMVANTVLSRPVVADNRRALAMPMPLPAAPPHSRRR